MDEFTNFLANNYIWFLIISLILLFALIGYLVDVKETKMGRKLRKKRVEPKIVDFSTVEEGKSLNQSLREEKTADLNLDAYVSTSQESSVVEEQVNTTQEEVKDEVPAEDNQELEVQNLESVNMDTENELPDLDSEGKKVESEFK